MIHNLTPTPDEGVAHLRHRLRPGRHARRRRRSPPAQPLWMDVAGLRAYPVFDVHKGQGKRGKFTFPDQATAVAAGGRRRAPASTRPPADMTLLATAGHLHPGGLWTDLKATRGSRTKELFRSEAKYFEPAGAVSWDVSMTHTEPGWRVAVKAGDRLNVSATYDTRRASWYESMGIMVVCVRRRERPGAKDPFKSKIDWRGCSPTGTCPRTTSTAAGRGGASPTRASCPNGGVQQQPGSRASSTARRLQPVGQARPAAGGACGQVDHLHEPRRDDRDLRPRTRPTTRSPPARRPVPAQPVSPTRWPTARSSSTRASSATARPASLRPRTATPGRRRRA